MLIKKAIVLAGGEGTRLRPITYVIPKPLLPVHKKPILSHFIEFLYKNGISEIFIVANNRHRKDFENWKASIEIPVQFFFEKEATGNFGAVRNLREVLKGEDFFVTNGDTLTDFNLQKLITFHQTNTAKASIALLKSDDVDAQRVILEGDVVTNMGGNLQSSIPFAVSGIYLLSPQVFEYDTPPVANIEGHLFPKIIKEKAMKALIFPSDVFYDCGTFERWEKAMREWKI